MSDPNSAALAQAERLVSENERMREVSGNVSDSRPLVAFLYDLMRDELVPGRVEKLLEQLNPECTEWVFTNGWLARHAQDIAERLTRGEGS